MSRLDDSNDTRVGPGASLDLLIIVAAERVREALPEGDLVREDVETALAMLLGYAWGIERILTAAAGGSHLPGHGVSVTGYVERLLKAKGQSGSDLKAYFADAIRQLRRTHEGVQKELARFAAAVVEALHPDRIEDSVQRGPFAKLFDLQGAYWSEYKQRLRNLDADGVLQIVQDHHERSSGPGKAP